jgi:hypothetical protein
MSNRALRKEKLVETAERLQRRIQERFPDSGLGRIAAEVVLVCKEALARAEKIRQPNLWLRGGLVLIGVAAVGGTLGYIAAQEDQVSALMGAVGFFKEVSGAAAFLGAAALFLVTFEFRLKRRRALEAIHELRALAHLVDMHQLTKDPDSLGHRKIDVAGKYLDAFTMGRYLAYCTELLALLSKIAQIYVQDFPDATAMAAVDQFENLSTGLSGKIWQKLMFLERLRDDDDGPPRLIVQSSRADLESANDG